MKDNTESQATQVKFYSPTQAAAMLDVKVGTFRRWMLLRKVQFVKIGRLVRIPASEIARLTSNVIPMQEVVQQ